jgi:hypothetical protein
MSMRKCAVAAVSLIAVAALLGGTACKSKSASEQMAENRLERAMEKVTGGKVDLDLKAGTMKVKTAEGDSVLTTGEHQWPEDLPESAIKFEDAKVRAVARSSTEEGKNWTIHLLEVGENALAEYSAKLKDGGWTIQMETTAGQGGTTVATKDGLMVNVMINADQKVGMVSFQTGLEK